MVERPQISSLKSLTSKEYLTLEDVSISMFLMKILKSLLKLMFLYIDDFSDIVLNLFLVTDSSFRVIHCSLHNIIDIN